MQIITQLRHGIGLCAVDPGQGQVLPFQQVLQVADQVFRIEELAGLNRLFLIFVRVEGGDSLLGRAVFFILQALFLQFIQQNVPRQHQ